MFELLIHRIHDKNNKELHAYSKQIQQKAILNTLLSSTIENGIPYINVYPYSNPNPIHFTSSLFMQYPKIPGWKHSYKVTLPLLKIITKN